MCCLTDLNSRTVCHNGKHKLKQTSEIRVNCNSTSFQSTSAVQSPVTLDCMIGKSRKRGELDSLKRNVKIEIEGLRNWAHASLQSQRPTDGNMPTNSLSLLSICNVDEVLPLEEPSLIPLMKTLVFADVSMARLVEPEQGEVD